MDTKRSSPLIERIHTEVNEFHQKMSSSPDIPILDKTLEQSEVIQAYLKKVEMKRLRQMNVPPNTLTTNGTQIAKEASRIGYQQSSLFSSSPNTDDQQESDDEPDCQCLFDMDL